MSAPARRGRTSVRRSDIPAAGPVRRLSGAGSVLSAILDHGPVARSTVARLTGLSPASVTGHTGRLMARGLVRESEESTGPKGLGRPHIPLEIDTSRHVVAGAHIAVAHSTVSLMDLRGRILAEDRQPHRGTDAQRILDDLATRLPRLVRAHAAGQAVLALGVATGHRVDPETGVVIEHPQLGWRDVPVRDVLAAATGLQVQVDSHARALARAEQMLGEATTRASTVLLFVGAVVDAAFATAGAMHLGRGGERGSSAARVGRVRRCRAVLVRAEGVLAVRGVGARHGAASRRTGAPTRRSRTMSQPRAPFGRCRTAPDFTAPA
ncbi:ROK family protein [Streptomyces himalayensis]|uniref:ROK family protein n=1 Tax=Streptomyces himalayensis TaxID=2820085 RepID=UPI0028A875C3|nr:ROK family protein [Streptomyces himalayensis]